MPNRLFVPCAPTELMRNTFAPTAGLALCKRALDESWSNDLDAQLDLEREFQREASLTPDYAEGVRAFFEKRPPKFTGRRESE